MPTVAINIAIDDPHDLMSGHDPRPHRCQFTLGHMQIRSADAAGLDAHADFPLRRLRVAYHC